MPAPGRGGSDSNSMPRWQETAETAETARAVETFRAEALEARDALCRCEAELSLLEGRAAKREADLRHEIIDLRSGQSRERDRLRGEAKRLQASLKDAHQRLKAEAEARAAATAQVEVLRQQLATARSETQKKLRELQEAKAASDEAKTLHSNFLEWLQQRFAGLGEVQSASEALSEATLKKLVDEVLARRSSSKERGQTPTRADAAVEARAEKIPEADSKGRTSVPVTPGASMRTEARSRVRNAEAAQRVLHQELLAAEEARAADSELYQEELQHMQLRLATLQRAKEASERYVEEEEDAWIKSKELVRIAGAEVKEAYENTERQQAEAAAASKDAVRALAAQQAAEAGRRRLEAELADVRETAKQAEVRLPSQPTVDWQALRRREAAVIEEVAESQRQVARWQKEVTQLRAALADEETSVQRLSQRCTAALSAQQEQAKIAEAQREILEQTFQEQADALRLDCVRSLEKVEIVSAEQRSSEEEAENCMKLLHREEAFVAALRMEVANQERASQAAVGHHKEAEQELAAAKAESRALQDAAEQSRAECQQEISNLHSNYARRLQALRAECGGQRLAAEAMEDELRQLCAREVASAKAGQDELRQLYVEEVSAARVTQVALKETAEAAAANEAAEARLARAASREELAAATQCKVQVQEEVAAELLALLAATKADLAGDGAALQGLPPGSLALLGDLAGVLRDAIRTEVQSNPCSSLRRSLCRDLKQEMHDQMRSESLSSQRSCRHSHKVSSTRSTTGSGTRRRPCFSITSPDSAAKEELSQRGAALMAAFAHAADEASPLRMPSMQSEQVW